MQESQLMVAANAPCSNTIAAGAAHTLSIQGDHTVQSWGYNNSGVLGSGSYAASSGVVRVVGLGGIGNLSNVTSVAAGGQHSLALDTNGHVWAWGDDTYGQIGLAGSLTGSSATPVVVVGLPSSIVTIGAGYAHSLAVAQDGTVWAWGENGYGQLGNGTHTTGGQSASNATPTHVVGPSGTGTLNNVVAVTGGGQHSLALKADGTVWAWGWNYFGQLGNGSNDESDVPVQVQGLTGVDVIAIAAGYDINLALDRKGGVWTWGQNSWGNLGNGGTSDSSTAMPIAGPLSTLTVIGISEHLGDGHALALDSSGTVWSWGYNGYGQLGYGTIDSDAHSIPEPSSFSGVALVVAGSYHSLALESPAISLFEWGSDSSVVVNSPVPVSVLGSSGILPQRRCASN